MKLPMTPAGKLHLAMELIELVEAYPWYKKLYMRLKYGENWKQDLFLSVLE